MPVKRDRFGTLTPCEVCANEISNRAEVCPFCGERYKMHPVVNFSIIMSVLSILATIGILNN